MQDDSNSVAKSKKVISKKSWTAYFLPAAIILLVIASMVVFEYLVFGVFAIAVLITLMLDLHSYELYMDEKGVWLYGGIFPWNKGSNGVKWRDLDEAVYYTGFLSWALRSYTIQISHRFTKDNEIRLTHMRRGHEAVKTINKEHEHRLV